MSFRDLVMRDNKSVFCNPTEFADLLHVAYEGITYAGPDGNGIPAVLTNAKDKDRRQLSDDHAEGIYRVNATMHVALSDLNGIQPEKGSKLRISEDGDYYKTYYIVTSACQVGMVILELEALDE